MNNQEDQSAAPVTYRVPMCTTEPLRNASYTIPELLDRTGLTTPLIDHPLSSIDPLSESNETPIPPCWYIVSFLLSKDRNLKVIDWCYIDRVTSGQVRRAIWEACQLRKTPSLLSQHRHKWSFGATSPDVLFFCLLVAFSHNLGYRVIMPEAFLEQLAAPCPAAFAYFRTFARHHTAFPAAFEQWLQEH